MDTSWTQPEAASESRSWQHRLEEEVEGKNKRRWRRRRPPGVGKQQAQKEKSSGLTAVGLLLPPAANQDSGAGSKMVDGFTQSHKTCLFLPIFFFVPLFFLFVRALTGQCVTL